MKIKWWWPLALVIIGGGLFLWGLSGDSAVRSEIFFPPDFDQFGTVDVDKLSTNVPEPEGKANFLIMGLDCEQADTQCRSDVIMVVRVNFDDHSVQLVSFARDFWVYIPGVSPPFGKINCAAYGGPERMKATLWENFGLAINHYVVVDFEDFRAIAEIVGLDGEQALAQARNRSLTGGDFTRMRNQQELLISLKEEALNPETLSRLVVQIPSLLSAIETDLSDADIAVIAKWAIRDWGQITISGEVLDARYATGSGYEAWGGYDLWVLYPDESRICSFLDQIE
ncbi:LCP family protein [Patescibacteria group bacterium]|nr:LCP family protein [Patescibacteria group bacterium]